MRPGYRHTCENVCKGVHTCASPVTMLVFLQPWRARAPTSIPCRGVLDVLRRLEWARLRAVPAGSSERMKSSTCDPAMCFPITLNRPTQGIPMEYRSAEAGDGYRKAGCMNDSRGDLSAKSKRPRLPRIGIRDSVRPVWCYQFLIADRKIFLSQTRNTYYS